MISKTGKLKTVLFLIVVSLLVVTPSVASAADENGFVGCSSYDDCNLCAFLKSIQGVVNWVIRISFIIATAVIVVGGLWMLLAGGADGLAKGKAIITKALMGLGMILGSWLLVNFIIITLAPESAKGTAQQLLSWFEINCDVVNEVFAVPLNVSYQSGSEPDPIEPGRSDPSKPPGKDNPISGPHNTTPDDSGYTYDPGIQAQFGDASEELRDLLDCMQSELPTEAKRISSISDSEGIQNCIDNYSRSPCAHGANSCHYGGQKCRDGQSRAVDFGNENYYQEISKAALKCGADTVVFETNHVHISVSNVECLCR